MINIIWAVLLISGLSASFLTNRLDIVTSSILNSSKTAIELSISLLGIMCFWNGIMKIAVSSGSIDKFAKLFRPIVHLLFRDLPINSSAIHYIIMNLSANFLGLGNAATPFGIKAMEEMQKLNLIKDEPTDDMCMFLVINDASIQLLPTTIISLRIAVGSASPMVIVPFVWITSLATAILAISLTFIFRRIYNRRIL